MSHQSIDIIAPSHLCSLGELRCIERLLTDSGHQVHIANALVEACTQSKQRLDSQAAYTTMQEALTGEAHIIWALRGGYGASRLLPALFALQKPTKHKWFVGSSDATVLHIFFNQQWQWRTIHGVMLARNKEMAERTQNPTNCETSLTSILDVINCLQSNETPYHYSLTPLNNPAHSNASQHMQASGLLVGGNLSLLCATLGTANQMDTHNKILVLEDVNESAERLDRMLEQLVQANLLQQAVAICLGQFSGIDECAARLAHPLLAARIDVHLMCLVTR